MRHAKTIMEMSNMIRPEHKTTKASKQEVIARKMIRKLNQNLAARKIEMDKETGFAIPNDLREEGVKAALEKAARKQAYEEMKAAKRAAKKAKEVKE